MYKHIRLFLRLPIVFLRILRINYLRFRGVKIGKNVWISPGAKIDTARGQIIISDNCRITHGSVILSHDISINLIRPGSLWYGQVFIGKNVFIGVNAVILPFVSIGDNAIIGAGTVVNKDVPANTIVVGNPARVLREVHKDPPSQQSTITQV